MQFSKYATASALLATSVYAATASTKVEEKPAITAASLVELVKKCRDEKDANKDTIAKCLKEGGVKDKLSVTISEMDAKKPMTLEEAAKLLPPVKADASGDSTTTVWYTNPWIYGPAAGILVLGIAGGAYMAIIRKTEQDI